jgi:hypothetical protein
MRASGPGPGDGDADDVYREFARKRLKLEPRPNEIPGILPVGRFLGRSEAVAVALMSICAYSTGLQFDLVARSRPGHSLIPTRSSLAERVGVPVVPPPQFDVRLADGAQAVTLDRCQAFVRLDELGDRPVVIGWRGGGTPERFDGDYWLTPKPQSGLSVQFSWAHFGLGTTETHVAEEQLRATTESVVELWPWDPTADVQ